jgi:alkylation response protein AidB-like acyl-CoA dehydrogenase
MTTTTERADALFEALHDLSPQLREAGARGEADRNLPADVIDLLRAHGFFRLWTPHAYGGLELHPTTGMRLFEELAALDSAAAWVVANCAVITTFCQVLPTTGTDELFSEPDRLVCGGWFPFGAARPVDGGYRLEGRWQFGSGVRHADWLTASAVVLGEDGQPVPGPDGRPTLLLAFFEPGAAQVVDNWDTLGMRGTGSHDVVVADAFVPARRTSVIRPWDPEAPGFQGPLYRFHMWLGAAVIAAVALGVARAAVDELTTLAQQKTPSYTERALAEQPLVQDHVARATAAVGAGRAYLHHVLDELFARFAAGEVGNPTMLAPVQLAACHAVDASIRAVDLVLEVSGTSGLRCAGRLERHLRDVRTITQHTLSSAARWTSVGQLLLGRQSDWMFFYL